MIEKIKEFLFGIDIISVEDATVAFMGALKRADKDENGMLSLRELIGIFREVARNGES